MKILTFLEQVPDYLYPLSERDGERRLYFKKAYDHRLNLCVQTFGGIEGAQRHCWRLIIWREICHAASSLVFIVALHYFIVPTSLTAAALASLLFVGYFIWQEYVLQPRIQHLKQILFKANLDILAWTTPVVLYWLYLFVR